MDSKKRRSRGKYVNHTLMRNDMYIFFDQPEDWKNEIKIKDGVGEVICDAMFSSNNYKHFLEVDLLQKMAANRNKIERYKEIHSRGSMQKKFGYFPTLVLLTTTEHRRKQLQALCKDIPSVVYTTEDIL